jgi:selenocysteine-specific elongation factor
VRQLILGTAGHIDHGKTALVRALTGVDTDRLPEEKRRGITIDLGFADLLLGDDLHFGIVDVPGHENFIRNMLAGATGIDIGLLVVAADEGVMPQTREHLAILELVGVRDLVVALTKSDLAEVEWRQLVREDVLALMADGQFARAPIIDVSARTGSGLDALRLALTERAAGAAARSADDLLRLPIDRVFTVRGTGTVVTGTLWSGRVVRDRAVIAMPGGAKARVRAVQIHGRERHEATAGERTALALAGVDRDDLDRGDVLVDDPAWQAASIMTARMRILQSAPPLRRGQRVRFHLGTAEVAARVVPFGGTTVQPGDTDHVQLRLESPVVARAGDRFVIRSWSPIATIGGGRVSEPAARRRKRIGDAVARRLDAILDAQPAGMVAAAAGLAGWTGLEDARVPVRTPLAPAAVRAAIADHACAVTTIGNMLFHDGVVREAGDRVLAALGEFHRDNPLAPGLSREHLRQAVPASSTGLADHVIARLAADGVIEIDQSLVRLAQHEATLAPDQSRAGEELLRVHSEAGFASPAPGDLPPALAARPDLEDLLHHLARSGRLVQLAPDRYLEASHAVAAAESVRSAFAGRTDLSPGDFRDLFGISRKFLLPLLGWLDRIGVTVRDGEVRQVPALEAPPQDGRA